MKYRSDIEREVLEQTKGDIAFMGLKGRDAEAYKAGAAAGAARACMIAGCPERQYDRNGNEIIKKP